jgi:hypothetical protein
MNNITEIFKPVNDLTNYQLYLIEKSIQFQISKIKNDIIELNNLNLDDDTKNIIISKYNENIQYLKDSIYGLKFNIINLINNVDYNKKLSNSERIPLFEKYFERNGNILYSLDDIQEDIDRINSTNVYPSYILERIKLIKFKFECYKFIGNYDELYQALYDVFNIDFRNVKNKNEFKPTGDILVFNTEGNYPLNNWVISDNIAFDGYNVIKRTN